jgi:CRP-like cAMP-binding protein
VASFRVGTATAERQTLRSADFNQLVANYVGRWHAVQLRCSNFMSCTLEERVALVLLELSYDFGMPDALGTRLTVKARQKDLAELLGASRSRVSEDLMEFEHRGFIVRKNRAADREARSAGRVPATNTFQLS